MFGVPMEHISFRDTVELYEAAPLDTAIQIWNNTAHEGMLKALKHKIVGGLSVLDRLRSGPCDEQALLCLYFDQLITKKQLKERLSHIVRNEGILGSFLQAINRLKVDKPGLQLVRTALWYRPFCLVDANPFVPERYCRRAPCSSSYPKRKAPWAVFCPRKSSGRPNITLISYPSTMEI